MRLDNLDVKIVGLLQADARLSFREIAERLGSTTPTVSARVKALEDIGLLRGYRAELDHSVLGGMSYILTLTMQPPNARDALARIKEMPGTYSAHLLPGGRIVAHIHLRPPAASLANLDRSVAEIPGVLQYDASEVIEGYEHQHAEDIPENVEVPCHQCKGPIHGEPVKGKFGERTHVFCCKQCLGSFRERYAALEQAANPAPRLKVASRQAKSTPGHEHHHH